MSEQVSPFFLRDLLEVLEGGAPDYLGCEVWAAILCEDSEVLDDITTKETFGDFTTIALDEYSTVATGYARKQLGSVSASANGALGVIDATDLSWATLAGGASNDPRWICVYVLLAGAVDEYDDANCRIALVVDAQFEPDGQGYSHVWPANGWLQLNGVPA